MVTKRWTGWTWIHRSGFEPWHRLVSLDKKLCSTMSLFTQVCKWVPAAYCWESPPAMDWHPVQRGVTLLAGASWHRNWNNLQWCELHGLKCTFTFSYQCFSSVGFCYEPCGHISVVVWCSMPYFTCYFQHLYNVNSIGHVFTSFFCLNYRLGFLSLDTLIILFVCVKFL